MKYWIKKALGTLTHSLWLYKKPSFTAIKNLLYFQEVGYFQTGSDYFTERAGLKSYLLLVATEGSGQLRYIGRDYTLEPHTAFFIDCTKPHRYAANGSWNFYFLHVYGYSIHCYFSEFFADQEAKVSLADSVLEDGIKMLIHLDQTIHSQNDFVTSKRITDILTNLLLAKKQLLLEKEVPSVFSDIRRYLDTCYSEKISLESMAKKFYISESYLLKGFKKYYQTSPIVYLNSVRIEQSKNLLKSVDLNIDTVAERVGIPNTTHYINLFKKLNAITPGKYRKL